ncbi:hypothetical protein [Anaerobium acetethylicum]|uniref:Alpha-L-rhamnosidase n=1 Tax=Anaerobium acetethylicum TaxID=1619234 RepID=A0A1D3TYJ7_9FIRM|nr:hypothetical protein [Anaerobium acetethylicum]SCP99522.1 hypothetical protein SAMN05421730_104417 [Anaerobium acetethylicum]
MKQLQEVLLGKEGNYIFPFFWQHGEEENVLREYMNAIHQSNIRAICVESRPHPDFCGEQWWHDMDIILKEAEKLKMKVWILDDSHFPTGFANGAIKNAPDELTHQYLVYRTLEMCGPAKHLELDVKVYMKPEPLPPWMPPAPPAERVFHDDELMKVLACPVLEGECLGEPVDLTNQIADEMLEFDLEDGYWRIFVIYLTRNAKGRNDYINFMDKESCRLLIDAVYEPHYAHYGEYFGTVIAGFFSDEPPVGNIEGYGLAGPIGSPKQILPWSKEAATCFREEFGSDDWGKYLPYLWANAADRKLQAKERVSYMNMVTKLVSECFSEQNGIWCKEHGVEYIGHMLEDCDMNSDLGASMGHFFRGLSGQHMAGIDNIGGQVTINGQDCMRHQEPACQDEAGFYQYLLGKLGASHASIDPKKQGRCMCENFGAYGWQSGTKEQKYMTDHFMVRGVNRFVPHAFSAAPFPDPDCPPHFYAHGENPLYRAFGELMAYTNRVCHLIDGGKACPDVALLYNGESKWAGDASSNIRAARYLTQSQIDFHVIPSDVFTENSAYPVAFDGQALKINDVSYGGLLISGCEFVEEHVAGFIIDALAKEFPVIFLDQKPGGIIAASDEEKEKFATRLEDCEVVDGKEAGKKIRQILTPQVTSEPACNRLVSYHYHTDSDIYLFLNEGAKNVYRGTVTIQGKGCPVRYYPWENRIEKAAYEETANGIKVMLAINPLELCVIVLEDEMEMQNVADKPEFAREEQEITEFSVRRIDAKTYLELKKKDLQMDVAEQGEKVTAPFSGMQKKYPDYSGYYIYETEAVLEAGKSYQLSIEDVSESVEVFLNGQSLGMKLQRPFVFILPGQQVSEENQIRIEVATMLERKLYSQGYDVKSMSPYRPLSPTGIVGKVTLQKVK